MKETLKQKTKQTNFKKAISLIVLVITIIVLAILAAAVIISISNTNIMQKALATTFEADMQELKSKYTIWLAGYIAENEEYDINEINYATGDSYLLNTILGGQVPDKYKSGLKVVKGKLVYGEEDSGSGSGAVTNPHEGEEWDYAWAYNPTDGWSDKLTAGDAIPANATITAKFYANGETVTPGDINMGTNVSFNEGDAYDMVIEGTGEIASLATTDGAWFSETMDYLDDTSLPLPLAVYVTNATITDGITNIGDVTFGCCTSLTTVTLSEDVTSIGISAFVYCSKLTSINIPNAVTSIGMQAFVCCTSLSTVTIPDSVTSIGSSAFGECTSLTEIVIPNSVTSMEEGIFNSCSSLSSITLSSNLTSIGNYAFSATNLSSITIPSSVTSIGTQAFSGCTNLANVNIQNGVTSIGDGAFFGCTSLSSITIPSSVTNISLEMFYGCANLATVNIPSSVTTISPGAFAYCTSLETVNIPSSVTSIGGQAFYDVPHIYYDGTAEGSPWGAVAIN